MRSSPSRVLRPRSEARANYDRLSRWYDLVSTPFERTGNLWDLPVAIDLAAESSSVWGNLSAAAVRSITAQLP